MSRLMNILSRELGRELYQAHQERLGAGGRGAGRLVVDGEFLIGFVASARDLRGAKFSDCNLTQSNLSDCIFHGAKGVPELDNVTVRGVDLSADGDGSGMTDADSFLERWKSGGLT